MVAAVAKYGYDLEPAKSSAKARALDETFFWAHRFVGHNEQEVLYLELVLFCQKHKFSDWNWCYFVRNVSFQTTQLYIFNLDIS